MTSSPMSKLEIEDYLLTDEGQAWVEGVFEPLRTFLRTQFLDGVDDD